MTRRLVHWNLSKHRGYFAERKKIKPAEDQKFGLQTIYESKKYGQNAAL
jgi:hypothetical protein